MKRFCPWVPKLCTRAWLVIFGKFEILCHQAAIPASAKMQINLAKAENSTENETITEQEIEALKSNLVAI